MGPLVNSRCALQAGSLRALVHFLCCALWLCLESGAAAAAAAGVKAASEEAHLGSVSFPVSCTAAAQEAFEHAVTLLHHMTYPQAKLAFEETARLDPSCAMAHWGIATTLFQPLWPTRPSAADLERGWSEVESALALQPPTPRERAYVATAGAFFQEPGSADYWLRIRRWEAAARALHEAFPQDPEASALYSLAHLATAPKDRVSLEHAARAATLLVKVYRANPEHPGAMHYLIHANDAPGRERELLEVVAKYEQVAPNNPHALHMPTHIYTRLGDWGKVIRGNLRAAEAALLHPAGADGEFVSDEFPHAIEYLVYASLQQGDDAAAWRELERLNATNAVQPSFKTAFHFASTQARYALERHDWRRAAELQPRTPDSLAWDRFKWPEAISWFARGLGSVRTANLAAARAAETRIAALEKAADGEGETLFARNISILHLELQAWIADAEGNSSAALELMQQAADLEVDTPKNPVTPGPILPAHEQLGTILMAAERSIESLAAFERALELHPGRLNGHLGAARAARAAKDRPAAERHYAKLLELLAEDGRSAVREEASAFVNR